MLFFIKSRFNKHDRIQPLLQIHFVIADHSLERVPHFAGSGVVRPVAVRPVAGVLANLSQYPVIIPV